MGREEKNELQRDRRRVLVVGNYCHDVLMQDGVVIGESLGGAASFISNVLDGLSIHGDYVSKVGFDFAYAVSHPPISSPSSMTTLFHAHFSTDRDQEGNQDRVLRRIHACDPIQPSELPEMEFDFGLAVGVGGEITPETLQRMLEICHVVFVDIQALIRVFDSEDGTVKLVELKESGFFHLLPRIGFLKASAEEAPFVNVEEARKWCCVVVTDGKDGCRVYSKDEKMQISPFPALQIDPTGAGDSFLGGLVAGLMQGLDVPDAALLGNFFGSMTVGHIGIPRFDLKLLEEVTDELQRKKLQHTGRCERTDVQLEFRKSEEHQEFHEFLVEVTGLLSTNNSENHVDSQNSHAQALYQRIPCQNNGQQKHCSAYEAALPAIDRQP